jgi:hypothetical protein
MEGIVDLADHATMIEEERQDPQRQEASRACGTCMEDPCVLTGISSVTKGVAKEETWTTLLTSVTEDATSPTNFSLET